MNVLSKIIRSDGSLRLKQECHIAPYRKFVVELALHRLLRIYKRSMMHSPQSSFQSGRLVLITRVTTFGTFPACWMSSPDFRESDLRKKVSCIYSVSCRTENCRLWV